MNNISFDLVSIPKRADDVKAVKDWLKSVLIHWVEDDPGFSASEKTEYLIKAMDIIDSMKIES